MSKVIAGLMVLMLSACAGDSGNSEDTKNAKGVIPESQLQALDKANGVEQQLLDADEKRREDMEARGI